MDVSEVACHWGFKITGSRYERNTNTVLRRQLKALRVFTLMVI